MSRLHVEGFQQFRVCALGLGLTVRIWRCGGYRFRVCGFLLEVVIPGIVACESAAATAPGAKSKLKPFSLRSDMRRTVLAVFHLNRLRSNNLAWLVRL